MTSVLVVAAHPDDEVLGCGGTLVKHAEAGDAVTCVFLADGITSRGKNKEIIERKRQARCSSKVIGIKNTIFLNYTDNKLDSVPLLDVVQSLEKIIKNVEPEIIYTHHGGDLNVDHRIAHQAVMTACRPQPGSTVQAIYAFEVPSSTEWAPVGTLPAFNPTRFIDISENMKQKREALECYSKEIRSWPHARSFEAVEALAKVRGACVGLEAAEAFMVIREIVK
ncbi:PIG-L deacetylase family protein [Thermopetrobacter sp. TC1]|uniref:PIG-L deacetylase family protein n=1 Tax=Thermopetrobacter sp. TC1 TaxID=1495045 RepID=UPI0009DDC88B|nr:PIG-L family deacetylase [Thermopetrobacter sp. TC1]